MKHLGAILASLGGLGVWVFSHRDWVTAQVSDDKAGDSVQAISGASWSMELTVLSIIAVAVGIVAFFVRGLSRRALGTVAAAVGVAACASPVRVLISGADIARAGDLLSSGEEAQISQWAQVMSTQVTPLGPILSMVSAVLIVLGGILLVAIARPVAPVRENEEENNQVFWDALDSGIDPTTAGADELPPERL
ncbi:MAG: Trp biosynthesis-associated membrane protein [Corynebacterium sp.]|nr:Trp biosynthesis-associated membrane protein [Corynebacterium sp.]